VVSLQWVTTAFAVLVIAYFFFWNFAQFAMSVTAMLYVRRYQRRRTPRNLALAARLAAPPLVSVVVPARNEALTIVESLHALLALDYEAREIVVVNDGSTDETLSVLQKAFQLVAAPVAFEQPLKTAPLRGVYRSIKEPGLVVLDKIGGGSKADAANAGINAASGQLVLVIDADTVLESDALTRAVMPFLEDPTTVAVGGHVGIANGCRIEGARVIEAGMPRAWLARFQVIEYLRSFMVFRLACASQNAVTLISGAFGLFLRSAVVEVGGYDHTSIGEDMDLTLRLQRFYREKGERIRIGFTPLPVCWTQAPEDLRSLKAQRCRWRRGLLQAFWRHRGMIGNPRFGVIGIGVLPYTAFFEGLGPLIELSGYVITTIAAVMGLLNWTHYRVMLAASVLFGIAGTLAAVFLSDIASGRYSRGNDLALLFASAVLENLGYRQLSSWWGWVGTWQAATGKGGWGPMTRRAFQPSPPERTG
jgi:cellulose synthase/poly-beta-1,6-N-acetylglucosamine synthase-like glycosyltransferase